MTEPLPSIETPLGPLVLEFACGDETTQGRAADASSVDGERKRWLWDDVGGARVELLVTPYWWPTEGSHFTISGSVGAVWRWTSLRATDAVTVQAAMPLAGDPANGECLEASEFETPDWLLVVGGPDDDCLGRDVEAGALPASWRGLLVAYEWGTDFGAVDLGPGSLAWRLPGGVSGDTAVHHVAVAWRPNDGVKDQEIGPSLAVDTTAEALLAAAVD